MEKVFIFLYIRFWHRDQLLGVYIKHTGRASGHSQAEPRLLSDIVVAIPPKPEIVCGRGATSSFVQLIDCTPLFLHGVQSPHRFVALSVEKLMHKKNLSVVGRIDFFSLLQFLVISLEGCLELEWTLHSPLIYLRLDYYIFSSQPGRLHWTRHFSFDSLSRVADWRSVRFQNCVNRCCRIGLTLLGFCRDTLSTIRFQGVQNQLGVLCLHVYSGSVVHQLIVRSFSS